MVHGGASSTSGTNNNIKTNQIDNYCFMLIIVRYSDQLIDFEGFIFTRWVQQMVPLEVEIWNKFKVKRSRQSCLYYHFIDQLTKG